MRESDQESDQEYLTASEVTTFFLRPPDRPENPGDQEYLTVSEVAALLRLTSSTVRRKAAAWHAEGPAAPVQVYRTPGQLGHWRLRAADIYALMRGRT